MHGFPFCSLYPIFLLPSAWGFFFWGGSHCLAWPKPQNPSLVLLESLHIGGLSRGQALGRGQDSGRREISAVVSNFGAKQMGF